VTEDDKPLGALLDNLGVVGTLREGQQVVEALVICKVVDFDLDGDDQVSVLITSSKGLDWVARGGLLAAAQDITSGRCEQVE
jgi:hypothetical protein